MNDESILDYFAINDAYSYEQREGFLEIFTYDISKTRMELKETAWQEIVTSKQDFDWFSLLILVGGLILEV